VRITTLNVKIRVQNVESVEIERLHGEKLYPLARRRGSASQKGPLAAFWPLPHRPGASER
jgi:hypothetical protein